MTAIPYLVAWIRPPSGTSFLGALYYLDDFGQYLSFAEQARHGAVLFINKFDPRPHAAVLVNIEWWLTGVLSLVLGGRLGLSWRLMGLGSSLAMAAAFWRLLELGGVGRRRVWALLVVLTGGGLGWLRVRQGIPPYAIPDVVSGIYPGHQILSNPHFVVGAALLWWSILLFLQNRRSGGMGLGWTACAYALGLSRPYDLAPFFVVVTADVILDRRLSRTQMLGELLPLTRLLPVVAYYGWLLSTTSVAGWGIQAVDLPIDRREMFLAVLPSLVPLLLFARHVRPAGEIRIDRLCAVWSFLFLLVVMIWPAAALRQVSTSVGAAVLLLAVSRTPPRWLPLTALALVPTFAFLIWRVLHPPVGMFIRDDYAAALGEIRPRCHPRDVVIAPMDLSLFIAMSTPCSVVLGHRLLVVPDEVAQAQQFYSPDTAAEWRLDYLNRHRALFLFIPAGHASWLGATPPYRLRNRWPIFELWERVAAAGEVVAARPRS